MSALIKILRFIKVAFKYWDVFVFSQLQNIQLNCNMKVMYYEGVAHNEETTEN